MSKEAARQAARYSRLQRQLEAAAQTLNDILWNEPGGPVRADDSRKLLRDAMSEYARFLQNTARGRAA